MRRNEAAKFPWPDVQSIHGVLNSEGNDPKGLHKNQFYNVNFVSSSSSDEKRKKDQLTNRKFIENQSVCHFMAVEGCCIEFFNF